MMKTGHTIFFENSQSMSAVPDAGVDLVVTSPPYPMIEMWDVHFSALDPSIRHAVDSGAGMQAFELMHTVLDRTWNEVFRVLKPGGFACINIGDATRTLDSHFCLYANHARILSCLQHLGFTPLPAILWRKQTNAPNKFMGSGMLPAGAYVTLEHEYILIVRKGPKREFSTPRAKETRRQSAIFWEERNNWFSDVWYDIKGASQPMGDKATRTRSAAYPFELAYRLINMYSVKEDLVLDPFLGIGTTMAAAMSCGRNSIGYEIDASLQAPLAQLPKSIVEHSNRMMRLRIQRHIEFCAERIGRNRPMKHRNVHYGFPVVTAQERELLFNEVIGLTAPAPNRFELSYAPAPQADLCRNWDLLLSGGNPPDPL